MELQAMQKHLSKTKQSAAKAPEQSEDAQLSHHGFDLRTTLDWLRTQGDLIETGREVDPDLEVTGLQKHMDGGCPILFENVKGKPNHRVVTNLFGDMKVINKMFGWNSDEERVKKLAYALSHPLKPEIITQDEAPVQQHIVKNPKQVNDYVVPIRHTTYETCRQARLP
jgi:4-hydroxy-3-polyprenylbenzoate decarboxylase